MKLADAKAKIEPFARQYELLVEAITELPLPELGALIDAALLMTDTNCSWSRYRVAQIILRETAQEVRSRRRRESEAQS